GWVYGVPWDMHLQSINRELSFIRNQNIIREHPWFEQVDMEWCYEHDFPSPSGASAEPVLSIAMD
ncbi:MAG TPA: hypothetical protein VJ969_07065, partial [Desulfopila sp.]|nr:hypothetical protein [Desulfopila sp.]